MLFFQGFTAEHQVRLILVLDKWSLFWEAQRGHEGRNEDRWHNICAFTIIDRLAMNVKRTIL